MMVLELAIAGADICVGECIMLEFTHNTHKKNHIKTLKNECGFTLIDLAIATLVIGLLVAPLVTQYKNHLADKEFETVDTFFTDSKSAIDQYYFTNEKYPCPADPALGPNDANYGVADCTNPPLAGSGIQAIVDAGVDNDGAGGDDIILKGAIPFKDLLMKVEDTLDPYGNKFNYAVSYNLTPEMRPHLMPAGGISAFKNSKER